MPEGSQHPDLPIVQILAEHLRCEVALADQQTSVTVKPPVSEGGNEGSSLSLPLPSGAEVKWSIATAQAQQSLAHAKTILDLYEATHQRDQLQAENDALTSQVMKNFEELALLRSLAASMELPSDRFSIAEIAVKSLRPLAEGIGAASIAAVFLKEESDQLETPLWSGPVLTSDDELMGLIDAHRDQAKQQPVVHNRSNEFGHPPMPDTINEFVILQCRSEGRLHGWLVACNRIEEVSDAPWSQRGFTTVQASLLETATHQLAAQVHNMRLLRQKEALYTDVVRALVNAVEARDPYTCGHSERVASFARCLAGAIGEPDAGCDRVYLTGLLHDVGKIAVPDGILQKPGQLNDEERAIIETHTEVGWRILHELDAMREVLPGVLYHHEHFDGNGYPDGLVGENIPLDGRILAVCDAFDAMTSDRPYRAGMRTARAVEILRSGAGSYWDPQLIDAFIDNLETMQRIRHDHRPREPARRPAPDKGRSGNGPLN